MYIVSHVNGDIYHNNVICAMNIPRFQQIAVSLCEYDYTLTHCTAFMGSVL